MKFLKLFTLVILAVESNALTITQTPEATEPARLEKRAKVKEKIYGKDYQKLQAEKKGKGEPSSQLPRAWPRTISSTKVMIVTPTVIAGVTFSTRPPKTTNGLEPWISLDKDGSPKTIKPQHKDGQIKKGKPDYGSRFGTVTIVPKGKAEVKAENMEDDDVFEDETYFPEDPSYHELNPIIRCTPERYFKMGGGKNINSEPFCTPTENQVLKLDKTYFFTWFSRYFKDAKKVRVHLTFVKESLRHKGTKRSLEHDLEDDANVTKRSSVLEKGGTLNERSFFASEWLDVEEGMLPITIIEEWFGKKDWYRKILVSLQPDTVDFEDFDYLKDSVVIEISKGARVSKGHLEDVKKLEEKWRNKELNVEIEEGPAYEKYIIMMSVPTCVVFFGLCMYIFVMINNRSLDLSHLKKRKSAGKNTTHRRIPFRKKKQYTELPQYKNDAGTKAD